MLTASLINENISVFRIFENRENFSAQPQGLFLRNNCKMPEKRYQLATFTKKRHKDREFQSQKSKSKSSFGNEVEFLINCSLGVGQTTIKIWLKDAGLTVNRKWKSDEIQTILKEYEECRSPKTIRENTV